MPKIILDPARRALERVTAWIMFTMRMQGKTQQDIGELLDLPTMSVSRRLAGKTPWKFEEVVTVVSFLGGRLEDIL